MNKLFYTVLTVLSISVSAQEISKNKIEKTLTTLASDEMKGRLIGTEENNNAANYIAQQFKEAGLDFCTGESYLVPFEYKGSVVYNVCGVKKGKSEKTLGISAHFDHIGTTEDHVFNGADDNASGTTAVIEIASNFKNKTPEFSLLFMGFNGEEKGMLGSKALANNPAMENHYKNFVALFNLEMLATKSQFGENALYITGDDVSNMDELVNSHAANGLKVYPDPYVGQNLFYRSDNVSFAKKKLIAHSFSTVDMRTAKHYHQITDTKDVVNFDNLTTIINNLSQTIEKLTPLNFSPKYNENMKFK